MENQFQILFDKMKFEMQKKTVELKESITNSIMEKMDEKLKPILAENTDLKIKLLNLERELLLSKDPVHRICDDFGDNSVYVILFFYRYKSELKPRPVQSLSAQTKYLMTEHCWYSSEDFLQSIIGPISVLELGQCTASANRSPLSILSSLDIIAHGAVAAPDCIIAWENRFLDNGERRWSETDTAPADSPNNYGAGLYLAQGYSVLLLHDHGRAVVELVLGSARRDLARDAWHGAREGWLKHEPAMLPALQLTRAYRLAAFCTSGHGITYTVDSGDIEPRAFSGSNICLGSIHLACHFQYLYIQQTTGHCVLVNIISAHKITQGKFFLSKFNYANPKEKRLSTQIVASGENVENIFESQNCGLQAANINTQLTFASLPIHDMTIYLKE
ncbi:unnamed protein product [Leptidea sinapis]|uniref:Uncharacterized protein n=1 Tax=Leptidea sinapis TaxID=189913 RepID=A0A5E4QIB4_9NEOP|nr:unnamed protein product [Leptidea sinapis]